MGIIQIMKRKNIYFLPSLITNALVLFPAIASADFICSSDVSYKWVKTAPSHSKESGAVSKDSKEEVATAVPASPVLTDQPFHVRYASVERGGGDEAAAKMALGVELSRQKARASERCKREHESFGECLATKLSVKGTVLNSLSFSARAQLEKALTDECQVQQGTCLGVDSSEPACREVVKVKMVGTPGTETKPGDDSKKTDDTSKSAEPPPPAAKSDSKNDAKGKAKGAKK